MKNSEVKAGTEPYTEPHNEEPKLTDSEKNPSNHNHKQHRVRNTVLLIIGLAILAIIFIPRLRVEIKDAYLSKTDELLLTDNVYTRNYDTLGPDTDKMLATLSYQGESITVGQTLSEAEEFISTFARYTGLSIYDNLGNKIGTEEQKEKLLSTEIKPGARETITVSQTAPNFGENNRPDFRIVVQNNLDRKNELRYCTIVSVSIYRTKYTRQIDHLMNSTLTEAQKSLSEKHMTYLTDWDQTIGLTYINLDMNKTVDDKAVMTRASFEKDGKLNTLTLEYGGLKKARVPHKIQKETP